MERVLVVEKTHVEELLRQNPDPYLGTDLISAKAVKQLTVKQGEVSLSLQLGFPVAVYEAVLRERLQSLIARLDGVESVTIDISSKIIEHAVQKTATHLQGVKNIIAIASGKGGVGKSTTAANLALALQAEGATVGLLDADIYGPSQARMMGMHGRPEATANKKLAPKCPYGVQAMSIGLLIEEDTAMIWRGPMVTQALQQLLNDTEWTGVDYLIIDLPPGTGDVQLTLSQQIPVAGAVIVTTPQDIALLDARRAVKMFEKVEVPVLGVVENMSVHVCSQCGHAERIFGEGGGAKMAADYGIDLLGELPLDISIREYLDAGTPSVIAEPDGTVAKAYYEIARKITAKLSLRGKDYSGVFPKIVIQND
jgi:ATP-binding protein involved in chromosome partitioning